jgi:hypothetical protein
MHRSARLVGAAAGRWGGGLTRNRLQPHRGSDSDPFHSPTSNGNLLRYGLLASRSGFMLVTLESSRNSGDAAA